METTFAQTGAMQISGANLLVAAGQSRAANAPRGREAAFATALKGAEAQTVKAPVRFAPQDFEAGPEEASEVAQKEPAPASATPPASPAKSGTAGIAAPGSMLDIRV